MSPAAEVDVTTPEAARADAGGAKRAESRVEELVRKGVLSRHPDCPVCGSRERRAAPDAFRDNRYIRAIPLVAPISVAEVAELLSVQRCDGCSASYCDPWLSRRMAARLYTTGFGQHVKGWQVLHAAASGWDARAHAYWQERTWAMIRQVAGPVERYAELNCPFTGLLPFFRRLETTPGEYRELVRRSKRAARSRRRYPAGAGSVLRRVFEQRRPVPPVRGVGAAAGSLPGERAVVIEPSPLCWGANCISQGVSCHSLAPTLLAADLLTPDDLCRSDRRFDVAVLTQLDHFFEPLPVLERFLAASKVVVIASHLSNRFTKQHLYAFGPETAAHLANLGCSAVDATKETVHPAKREVNQTLFVSRQIRL